MSDDLHLNAATAAGGTAVLAGLLAEHADPAARLIATDVTRGPNPAHAAALGVHFFDLQEAAAFARCVLGQDAGAARTTVTTAGVHFTWSGPHISHSARWDIEIVAIWRADAEHLAYAAAYTGTAPARWEVAA